MSDLLKDFQTRPENQATLEEMLKHRPIVPAFFVANTKDEQDMVVEKVKYYTAMRNGFDLLYQLLTGKPAKGD